jgi:hypothetical protein
MLQNKYSKTWKQRNPEKNREITIAWQKNNPDKVKAIKHKYYLKNAPKIKKIRRDNYEYLLECRNQMEVLINL